METLKIEIINPKAKKLLQELANLQLITIKKDVKTNAFKEVLKHVKKAKNIPSMEVITAEVEAVRAEMYAAENK